MVALTALLAEDGLLAADDAGRRSTRWRRAAAPPAAAKRVIFLFMHGGPSHLETFDPKPELHAPARPAAAGESSARSRRAAASTSNRLLATQADLHASTARAGIEVSDLLPHIADVRRRPVRDPRLLRRQRHPPRVGLPDEHRLDPDGPAEPRALGRATAWAPRTRTCRRSSSCPTPAAGSRAAPPAWGNGFLPARLPGDARPRRRRRRSCTCSPPGRHRRRPAAAHARPRSTSLNRDHLAARGDDSELAARIAAYELAFRMQAARPGGRRPRRARPRRRRRLYGLDDQETAEFGLRCLLARRLVERGVRFVQVYCGDTNGWDAHADVEGNHARLCLQSDKPIAGLLTDLKRRGLLDDTLVIWGGEFGRTPMTEGDQRPRPQPVRLHDVAGRRRRQGRPGHRRDRRRRPARRRGPRPRPRPARHDPAPAGLDHPRLTFRHNGRDERLTDAAGEVIEKAPGVQRRPEVPMSTTPNPHAVRQFASDTYAGICPEALAALQEANRGHAPAYGDDRWTARATPLLRELFETDCAVFFVPTGTAANALALAALCQPYHSVICHADAHVQTDECGAPEYAAPGIKLVPVAGADGKLDPDAVRDAAARRGATSIATSRGVLSLSQATEAGTVYAVEELRAAIGDAARELGLRVHVDGARFANALATLGVPPRALTWQAGVDVLCFGGTKNGLAVRRRHRLLRPRPGGGVRVPPQAGRPSAGQDALRRRAVGGRAGVGSLAAQRRARQRAWPGRWRRSCAASPGLRVLYPVQANAVFVQMPPAVGRGPAPARLALLHHRRGRAADVLLGHRAGGRRGLGHGRACRGRRGKPGHASSLATEGSILLRRQAQWAVSLSAWGRALAGVDAAVGRLVAAGVVADGARFRRRRNVVGRLALVRHDCLRYARPCR